MPHFGHGDLAFLLGHPQTVSVRDGVVGLGSDSPSGSPYRTEASHTFELVFYSFNDGGFLCMRSRGREISFRITVYNHTRAHHQADNQWKAL